MTGVFPPSDSKHTSEHIAELAARGLDNPLRLSMAEIKTVCGAAATHAADHEVDEAAIAALFAPGLTVTPEKIQQIKDLAHKAIDFFKALKALKIIKG